MSRPTVLVVDPNPATRRRVGALLRESDVEVRAARDAVEARDAAGDADLRLVLLAASLPRGNGYDLARQLRELAPAARLVLVTGGFEVYNVERAESAGVDGHIERPFDEDRLRAVLEDVLGPLADLAAAAPTRADEPAAAWRPPVSAERVATILPRSYDEVPVVQVDPEVVGPEVERAILEVLPEVVEHTLRRSLATSPEFRALVERTVRRAVQDAVRETLGEAVERAAAEARSRK